MARSEANLSTGVREAWSILLLALCALLTLSLLSYDWRDISALQDPPNDPPSNFIGPAGAWLSYLLLMTFGLGAYLIPVWFLGFGITLIFRGIGHVRAKLLWALVCMLALSGLLSLGATWWTPLCQRLNIAAPGGLPAQLLTAWLVDAVLGELGTAILLVAVLLAALVMFFGWEAIQRQRQRLIASARWLLEKWRTWRVAREVEEVLPRRYGPRQPWRQERIEQAARREVRATEGGTAAPVSEQAAAGGLFPMPEKGAPPPDAAVAGEPAPAAPVATAEPSAAAPPKPRERVAVRRKPVAPGQYQLPPLSLLSPVPPEKDRALPGDVETTARIIQETLADFGIKAEVRNVESGPVVTRYELLPAPGVRVERIASLSNNLALSLKATSVRVQAPIPGKGMVGVEVPNTTASRVYLREILEGPAWRPEQMELPLAIGKDVGGNDIVADLTAMPHLLIAGATGSGKTVCMNSLLAGLLMARTPEQLRFLLIDPKIVEFATYNHLPHLLGARSEVITTPKRVAGALRWAINEMEHRYRILARAGVRNIRAYNSRPIEKQPDLFGAPDAEAEHNRLPERLPYVVIVIDELADLMATAQAEIETYVCRLAQLSRAVGIHMILATQRPSVNVITGTIKANFPARIAFQVAQKVDSRTILDANGADKLLGRGDMLFLPPGSSKLIRAQGVITPDEDIRAIVEFIRQQAPPPEPEAEPEAEAGAARAAAAVKPAAAVERPAAARAAAPVEQPAAAPEDRPSFDEMLESGDSPDDDAELIAAAIQIIRETHRASTSSLQRRLRIGYNRAARIMDVLEERGIVGPARGSDPREILIDLNGDLPDTPPASAQEEAP